jgi:hypothetical protein
MDQTPTTALMALLSGKIISMTADGTTVIKKAMP